MSFLYLAGQYANTIEQALSVFVSDEDASFPKARLYDGETGRRFKFGTNGADRSVTIDMNRIINGDFETSPLVGWTQAVTGTGATSEENTLVHAGAHALKCTAGTGSAARFRDFTVRAGQRLYLDAWLRAASSGTARIRIQNLATGNYLPPTGVWQGASTDVATETGTTYVQKTLAFQVESFDACKDPTVTLRITLVCEGATGIAYFDDVAVYPTHNFVGVFGNNLTPTVAPQLRSSTDNFSASDSLEAQLTIRRPSFFGVLAIPVNRRYWRLKAAGTNLSTPWYGELVLGYAETIQRGPKYGWVGTKSQPQARYKVPGGATTVYNQTANAIPTLKLSFRDTSEASYLELSQEILDRTGRGRDPVIVVPSDAETAIIHGRVLGSEDTARELVAMYDTDIVIEGSGLSTPGA